MENSHGRIYGSVKELVAIIAILAVVLYGGMGLFAVFAGPVLARWNDEAAQNRITSNRIRPLAYNADDPETRRLGETVKALQARYGQPIDRNATPITIMLSGREDKLTVQTNDVWDGAALSVSVDSLKDPNDRAAWISSTGAPRLAADLFEQAEQRYHPPPAPGF